MAVYYECTTFLSFRVLAFSPHGISSVRVWLDGGPLPPATRVQEGPLYTTPWDPALVATGLHTITVVVQVNHPHHHPHKLFPNYDILFGLFVLWCGSLALPSFFYTLIIIIGLGV